MVRSCLMTAASVGSRAWFEHQVDVRSLSLSLQKPSICRWYGTMQGAAAIQAPAPASLPNTLIREQERACLTVGPRVSSDSHVRLP